MKNSWIAARKKSARNDGKKMKFGILGYGRFGQLWADVLSKFGEVMVYDKAAISISHNTHIQIAPLSAIGQADLIFITTPISLFESSCQELKNFVSQNALVMDCCSVKMHPAKIMENIFSKDQSIVATHPLFGPDSVKKSGGLKGHRIAVCPIRCDEIKLQKLIALLEQMHLTVLMTTPEEHDKQMACSQGLVHFIGRGLSPLPMQEQELSTPDYNALLNIHKMVNHDTWQLFLDMHRYNPFTKTIRENFVKKLIEVNNEVNNERT